MTEEGRSVFVTVGTTSFDELIGSIAEENFMKVSTVYVRNNPLLMYLLRYVYRRPVLRYGAITTQHDVSLP